MSATSAAFRPDLSKWEAWTPEETWGILADIDVPWYVAGGWAVDLFLGGQRRPHGDLEIAVPKRCYGEIADALSEYELCVVTASGEVTPAPVAASVLEATTQTWVRERATGTWRLDVLREPSNDETWICRRDASIRLPFERVIERTEDGIPYGCPEVTLLYKAAHAREPKHQDDFSVVLPRLELRRRRWLVEALGTIHPGHAWLGELERSMG